MNSFFFYFPHFGSGPLIFKPYCLRKKKANKKRARRGYDGPDFIIIHTFSCQTKYDISRTEEINYLGSRNKKLLRMRRKDLYFSISFYILVYTLRAFFITLYYLSLSLSITLTYFFFFCCIALKE